jgi:hypothetical protein
MSAFRSTHLVAWQAWRASRAYVVIHHLRPASRRLPAAVVLTDSGPTTYHLAYSGDSPPTLAASIGAVAAAPTSSSPGAIPDRRPLAMVTHYDIDGPSSTTPIVVKSPDGSAVDAILATAQRQARMAQRLDALGVDPAALSDSGAISVVATDEPTDDAGEGIGMIAIILLFLVITTYGQWVLLGVLEEKSTHVVNGWYLDERAVLLAAR